MDLKEIRGGGEGGGGVRETFSLIPADVNL